MLRSLLVLFLAGALLPAAPHIYFETLGYTDHGEWTAQAAVSPGAWRPGDRVVIDGQVNIQEAHLSSLAAVNYKAAGIVVLATAERSFDADGKLRIPCAERMSTVLTPSGLAIEGGWFGAVTKRYGYGFNTPLDQQVTVSLAGLKPEGGWYSVPFHIEQELPSDLPPGYYRVRLDYGINTGKTIVNLNAESFARRPFFKGRPIESHHYSPIIGASGRHVSGRFVEAAAIRPRLPWVLLYGYNSNGYRGVVANEDKSWFALSQRNLIHDDVILPMFDAAGRVLSYNLEPQVVTDTIELRNNIPWAGDKGELAVEVTAPDGTVTDLGRFPFIARSGTNPTTRNAKITAWKPSMYGQYTVRASGWYADESGNRYEGGGTYQFWIAKRMTLATATFQGMAYPVGNRYGRDIGFAPAFPAEVEVTATLFPWSDSAKARTIRYSGRATQSGVFGAAQGMQPLVFDEPGEYIGHVLARHLDEYGHLWVCSMRHAGVVYPEDSPIVARGKKMYLPGPKIYADRGHSMREGWMGDDGVGYLDHINFPYNQRDVLLIASENKSANKIIPTLIWEWKDQPQPYLSSYSNIGASNLKLVTSNGYSPHLFPEYITEWGYYYAAGPRPGFMSRFLVGEHNVRAPYWHLSPNSFGGQINASSNGDVPGDIYRLIGGVVVRPPGKTPMYAGYIASAFILPGGSNDNRIVAPGEEDVPGPYDIKARFFMVGLRPGMTYETGAALAPAVQIDPILPAEITVTLTYPDGRKVSQAGKGDAHGTFVGATRWPLDQPGLYRYKLEGVWEGHRGVMPGLPAGGGEFYVVEKNRPASVPELKLDMLEEMAMDPVAGIAVKGRSTAREVYFAMVIPGAVLDQGVLPVKDGRFEYWLNPKALEARTPTYDTTHRVSGRPEIGDVIHLTLFSKECNSAGETAHSVRRLIIRGTRVLTMK